MKINNNTRFNYQTIGKFIDTIRKDLIGDTIYYGKVDEFDLSFEGVYINIRIRYLKKYVEYTFSEMV